VKDITQTLQRKIDNDDYAVSNSNANNKQTPALIYLDTPEIENLNLDASINELSENQHKESYDNRSQQQNYELSNLLASQL